LICAAECSPRCRKVAATHGGAVRIALCQWPKSSVYCVPLVACRLARLRALCCVSCPRVLLDTHILRMRTIVPYVLGVQPHVCVCLWPCREGNGLTEAYKFRITNAEISRARQTSFLNGQPSRFDQASVEDATLCCTSGRARAGVCSAGRIKDDCRTHTSSRGSGQGLAGSGAMPRRSRSRCFVTRHKDTPAHVNSFF
jgi:hypothetical protein